MQRVLTWLLICTAPLAARVSSFGATISGEIAQDTTLSGTNTIVGTVLVRPGVVLTIAPGATILLQANALLEVRGKLVAVGTAAAPILFTREVAGIRWKGVRFIAAERSLLEHCTFEYADSAGTHLDYYDNDCNPATAPPARNYHEAIVLLATHVDFKRCTFRNLPDSSSTAEGDAIAVISDDPAVIGAASAHIDACQFLSIGQGIHTRYSHILVENSFFTGHRGDNDDIDMYGESTPPPLIRYNIFMNPEHDDMINPTRCSAIIIGNIVSGGDDHGIVLRDRCSPIVMNNLIVDCAAAGISVQNQCDALLVNNTIVDCARGVRFFDHDTRWGPPYCLFPGSGRATLINCLIRDCPESLTLADSPYSQDRGSHAIVYNCNVEGGRNSATVSANSTLQWETSNIDVDPQFAANGYRPAAGSPMIDAGIDPSTIAAAVTGLAPNDPDGNPAPLDGNGDGTARHDIGAYEFLLATADSNADGIPDGWLHDHGLHPLDRAVPEGNPDGDLFTTRQEWLADTNPRDPRSFLRIESIAHGTPVRIRFQSSANRSYTLHYSIDLITEISPGSVWAPVPGQVNLPGSGGIDTLVDETSAAQRFYRIEGRPRE